MVALSTPYLSARLSLKAVVSIPLPHLQNRLIIFWLNGTVSEDSMCSLISFLAGAGGLHGLRLSCLKITTRMIKCQEISEDSSPVVEPSDRAAAKAFLEIQQERSNPFGDKMLTELETAFARHRENATR